MRSIQYWAAPAAVTAVFLCASAGCRSADSSANFDRQVATAEVKAKAGTLSAAEIRQVHAFLVDPELADEERDRRCERAMSAIVDSGSMIWLQEFCQLPLDGAAGYHQPILVWRFATRHPDTFFGSPSADSGFNGAQQNPELAFGTNTEVQNSIQVFRAFAAASGGEKRRRAQAWAAVLEDMLAEYP
jgi:hypothetical protein